MFLWDYAIELRALIHNVVPRPLFQAQGGKPHVFTIGTDNDIYSICNFGCCEWVCYRNSGYLPENKEKLRRIPGSCKNEGYEMSQSIIASSVYVITHQTIRSLWTSEINYKTEKRKWIIFDLILQKNLGNSMHKLTIPDSPEHVPYSNGVGLCYVQFLDDNDPVTPDGTSVFE